MRSGVGRYFCVDARSIETVICDREYRVATGNGEQARGSIVPGLDVASVDLLTRVNF